MSPLDTNDVKVIIHEQIQEYIEGHCQTKHMEVQLEMKEIRDTIKDFNRILILTLLASVGTLITMVLK